jgi:hypothetical protein
LNKSVVCLKCRHLFDIAPQQCPFCEHATFVHLEEKEDPNSVCEELLFAAALVQMGFDQSRLNRSAVPNIPLGVQKRGKAARAAAGARAK